MKVQELNPQLIGKRVKCNFQGMREGVIIALVEEHDPYKKEDVIAVGVRIRFDEKVYQHTGCAAFGTECEWYQKEFESTCKVMPASFKRYLLTTKGQEAVVKAQERFFSDGGNLQYTEVID